MNPNLARRPAKPALGNGRVQRGALRALNGEATTSEVAEWTHVRARAYGECPTTTRGLPGGCCRGSRIG